MKVVRAARFAALMSLSACGASETPAANHAHFDAIQRHETTLEESAHRIFEGDGDCGDAETGCDAATSICEIADRVNDADASARCGAAQERCQAMRAARCVPDH
ncbi:MAG: hypothetical protein AAF938_14775 [Myxococcota bacterium]